MCVSVRVRARVCNPRVYDMEDVHIMADGLTCHLFVRYQHSKDTKGSLESLGRNPSMWMRCSQRRPRRHAPRLSRPTASWGTLPKPLIGPGGGGRGEGLGPRRQKKLLAGHPPPPRQLIWGFLLPFRGRKRRGVAGSPPVSCWAGLGCALR